VEARGEGVLTTDSSCGLELILVPQTPEDLCEWVFDNKELLASVDTDGDVGAHMHVSRTAFKNEDAIKRFVVLVNNALLNGAWEHILGQADNEYAIACPCDMGNVAQQDGRYVAVNCMPEHTVEVRSFRGTTSPLEMWVRIKYIQAAVAWCNEGNAPDPTEFDLHGW